MKPIALKALLLSTFSLTACGSSNPDPDHRCEVVVTSDTAQGTVTISPSQADYAEGDEITLVATAKDGYVFDKWVGISSTESTVTLIVDQDLLTIEALFKIPEPTDEFIIDITSDLTQGSVTISPEQETYILGTEVTITATPNAGYIFDKWAGISSAECIVTFIVGKNYTIEALFMTESSEEFTINVTSDTDQGTVEVMPLLATYPKGTEVTLFAVAKHGYAFDKWTGISSANSTVAFIVDKNYTIEAIFKEFPGIPDDSVYAKIVLEEVPPGKQYDISPIMSTGDEFPCERYLEDGKPVVVFSTSQSGAIYWVKVFSELGDFDPNENYQITISLVEDTSGAFQDATEYEPNDSLQSPNLFGSLFETGYRIDGHIDNESDVDFYRFYTN